MLTLQYTVGHDYHRYREVTIYGKLHEQLLDHRAEVGLSLRQPWGTRTAQFKFSQYLNDPSKVHRSARSAAPNIRIFKGFSVNFFGEFSRTRDQIYLPRGEASTEEILLRQRQLADRLPVLLRLRHRLLLRLDLQQHRQSALRRGGGKLAATTLALDAPLTRCRVRMTALTVIPTTRPPSTSRPRRRARRPRRGRATRRRSARVSSSRTRCR